ncbi:MAG: endolytic transglycosylase MltG [Myxococcota bacterium]
MSEAPSIASRRRFGSILLRLVLALLVLGLLAATASTLWVRRALSPAMAEGARQVRPIAFEVAPGDTMGRVARRLESEGLIRDARVARWFAKTEGIGSSLKIGEYELSSAQSTPEILDVLVSGRVRTHSVSIPEGLRAVEIADRLAEAGLVDRESFLRIAFDPQSAARLGVQGTSLEGYLYPDTYRFARGLPAERIVQSMVDQFRSVYGDLVRDRLTGEVDEGADTTDGVPDAIPASVETRGRTLTMLEFVTLASIVEKETGVPAERPLIAAVFLNRLARGMRLETDPTVIYGIEGFDGNLRRVHLEDSSNPYNTYRIRGLPPGPIANPGREALHAVLAPADAAYLYFVSRNDGTHVFSKSYAEHEAAVDRFQRRRSRR